MNANERNWNLRGADVKDLLGPHSSSITLETLVESARPSRTYARGMAFEVRHFSPLI